MRDPSIDEGRKMITISFLYILALPVITGDRLPAGWRTAVTGMLQHPTRLCCKQPIINSDFLVRWDVFPGHQSDFICHPHVRVAGMVHRAIKGLSDLNLFHKMQIFIDLNGVVPGMTGLECFKFRLGHHGPAQNGDNFTLPDVLTRKHAIPADRRFLNLSPPGVPCLRKVVFHALTFRDTTFKPSNL